ncbi:MAG: BamA/TamA family outer membrane protein [Sporocytophaga sp.]|uniref:BamA/TamA family outer membrane protein n=1 Tax=Sporocytophaga sp. TaxID=2231183 RepID=UPI001B01E5A6|nr:BamA/TamA family outer membrane protein [Sporocytophaga sp.]MBO9702792.1 BamA/TamA family outer membrane protein [Sporocytophaga sp.]
MRSIKLFFLLLLLTRSLLAISSVQDSALVPRKKRAFLVLPLVINTPETKFGGGALGTVIFKIGKDTAVRSSNVQSFIIYTQRKQIIIESGGGLFFKKENYIIKWFGTYSYFPDRFYGLGNNTPKSNMETYTYRQIYLTSQYMRKIYKKLYGGFDYELQDVLSLDYEPGGLFDQENILGKNGGTGSGLGPLIAWDNRNNAFYPTKGAYLQVSYVFFRNIFGSNFKFQTNFFDFRKFIKLGGQNVLALQLFSQITAGDVPVRNLAYIGGPFIMRGYYLGRYRDNNAIAVQSEYRMRIWRRFGAVAFAGLGEVSQRLKDYSIDGLKYSLGAGIRFAIVPKESINLRVDFAIGKNSSGFYLYLTEAF